MIHHWLLASKQEVSTFPAYFPLLLSAIHLLSHNFVGGHITSRLREWEEITSDKFILDMVTGAKIQFIQEPVQYKFHIHKISLSESELISAEIHKLLLKAVIVVSQHEVGEYISPVFLVDKKDGGKRFILNLKRLNATIEYHHFKMHNILHILHLVTKNCFMCVIDIKDAYYCVTIHPTYQKYLKFCWGDILYKFVVLPNGLSPAPRLFTKLMKPVTAALREDGHINSVYIDDMYLQGDDYQDCAFNVMDTIQSLVSLGFCPHPDKCQLVPKQQVDVLGFHIDSCSMQVSLTDVKRTDLLHTILLILEKDMMKIRELAAIIGKFVAAFPAVQYGPLYYRHLEKNKHHALLKSGGNYEALTTLTPNSITELMWWRQSLPQAFAPIIIESPSIEIFTDASNEGWGAKFEEDCTQGLWSGEEQNYHINEKEMLAVFFGIKSFLRDKYNVCVKLNIDNTSVVSILKHMGTSHNDTLNAIAKDIWEWAKSRRLWFLPVYIASADNPADEPSRNIYMDAEWQLNPQLFQQLTNSLQFHPEIDLFASRINSQLPFYLSYYPDPEAQATDAFSLSWFHIRFYCFPPFSCISRCLQKIRADKASGIIIVPRWPTQPFYPLLLRMSVQNPVVIHPKVTNLLMPDQPSLISEIGCKTTFLACHVSGTQY